MDYATHKDEIAEHYAAMARMPGARAQAVHSITELQREFPEEFADLTDLVDAKLHEDLRIRRPVVPARPRTETRRVR